MHIACRSGFNTDDGIWRTTIIDMAKNGDPVTTFQYR